MSKQNIDTHVSIVPVNSFSEVNKENKFQYLNRNGFVRTQKAREQWILLVNDAWTKTSLPTNDVVRDYLSIMLERYLLCPDLFDRLAGFNYLQHILEGTQIDSESMQEIADISLLYLSFVPGRSLSRHQPRSLRYSTKLGESLYKQLAISAGEKDDWFSRAFQEMSQHFGIAIMVLRSSKLPFLGGEIPTSVFQIPSDEKAADFAQQYFLYTQSAVGNS